MLIFILAATTAAADVPPAKAEPPCPAAIILVEQVPLLPPFGWSDAAKAQALLVSKIVEPETRAPKQEVLPQAEPQRRGPAVLVPACKPEQRKKKDHPMA
jgi:hypothetical protein